MDLNESLHGKKANIRITNFLVNINIRRYFELQLGSTGQNYTQISLIIYVDIDCAEKFREVEQLSS